MDHILSILETSLAGTVGTTICAVQQHWYQSVISFPGIVTTHRAISRFHAPTSLDAVNSVITVISSDVPVATYVLECMPERKKCAKKARTSCIRDNKRIHRQSLRPLQGHTAPLPWHSWCVLIDIEPLSCRQHRHGTLRP